MNDISDEDLRAIVDGMGQALSLPIRDDNRPVVESHLRIAFRMAEFVDQAALPEDQEPAPVFTA